MGLSRYWPVIAGVVSWIVANRSAHLLRVLGELVQIAILYFVWTAVYSKASTVGGLTQSHMVTYLFVAQIFRVLSNYPQEGMYAQVIRSGDVLRDLVLPQVYIVQQLALGLGYLLAMFALMGLPIMVVGTVFFGVRLPSLESLPAVALSLLFAMVITFSLNFIIGTCAFWTGGSVWGISSARRLAASVLGGSAIPLTLFPDWLRQVTNVLPFKAGIFIPTSVYLGQLQGSALWAALGQQVAWAVGLLFFASWFFNRSIQKSTIPGG